MTDTPAAGTAGGGGDVSSPPSMSTQPAPLSMAVPLEIGELEAQMNNLFMAPTLGLQTVIGKLLSMVESQACELKAARDDARSLREEVCDGNSSPFGAERGRGETHNNSNLWLSIPSNTPPPSLVR